MLVAMYTVRVYLTMFLVTNVTKPQIPIHFNENKHYGIYSFLSKYQSSLTTNDILKWRKNIAIYK